MTTSNLSYNNTATSELFFKELMTRNMGLILKSCGFDGVESRFLLNYLTDLHVKSIELFIRELSGIVGSHDDDDSSNRVFLSDLRLLLNRFNVINDTNFNIDETVLQIKDYTNNNDTSIIEEADTQGIEYFQKWVEENTVYNFDYRNLTRKMQVKNLNVFSTLHGEDDDSGKKKDPSGAEPELLDLPASIDPNAALDWVTFSFLNTLQEREQVVSYLSNTLSNNLNNKLSNKLSNTLDNTLPQMAAEEPFKHDARLAEKNDLLDTVLAPGFLRPLSHAAKRKADFLSADSSDTVQTSDTAHDSEQNDAINRLNDIRTRKRIKLSFEQNDSAVNDSVVNDNVDEILEELDEIKIPDIPIADDIELDLNWLGGESEF